VPWKYWLHESCAWAATDLPAAHAQDSCSQYFQGTLAANTVTYGPFNVPAGTTVRVSINGTADDTDYQIFIDNDEYDSSGGTLDTTENRSFSKTYSVDTVSQVQMLNDNGGFSYLVAFVCPTDSGGAEPVPAPGADPTLPGDYVASVFAGSQFSGVVINHDGVAVWAYDPSAGQGYNPLWVASGYIDDVRAGLEGGVPEENLLIDSSENGLYNVYLLTSGEIQINIGPIGEGPEARMFEIIFDGFPPRNIIQHEYRLSELEFWDRDNA
jgi:hypothetical protein